MAFLGRDANNDQKVRQALMPLRAIAERTNMAVVLVRHLNKSGGRHSMYRGSGSIGIIGTTRSGLLVGKHPDDPNMRVLCHTKSNLGPLGPSLLFEPVTDDSGVVRIEWRGECDYTADDLLKPSNGHGDKLENAKKFLLESSGRWPGRTEEAEGDGGRSRRLPGGRSSGPRKSWEWFPAEKDGGREAACFWELPGRDQAP